MWTAVARLRECANGFEPYGILEDKWLQTMATTTVVALLKKTLD
jgi:hypothetical protein